MWTKVENKFEKYKVRMHRIGISLSGELTSDSYETRLSKRSMVFYWLKTKIVIGLIFSIVGAVMIFYFKTSIGDFGNKIYQQILAEIVVSIPFIGYLVTFIKKALPYIQSEGTKILKEAQGFDKHNRVDFTEETGLMGKVKIEIGYLFDFLKTENWKDPKYKISRPVRLVVFVDDLDRCRAPVIMSVLETVILLLVDTPITCWLTIDSRVYHAYTVCLSTGRKYIFNVV